MGGFVKISSRKLNVSAVAAVLMLVVLIAAAAPASAQLVLTSADGKQSIKLGILGQFALQTLDTANGQETTKDLFIRRARVIGQVKWGDDLSLFFDTDSPNLGKGNPDGSKNNADLFLQDFVVTYTVAKEFQLDGGLILLAQDYNHNSSAASLLTVDYGAYTFNETTATTSRTGRDYGVQARGYLFDDHLEYRVGAFQGFRGIDSKNDFRYAGRLAFYVVGPETGLFYRGTSLGKLQTLSIAGSFDTQKDYSNYGFDVFFEQPVNGGDGLTAQFDYNWLNGKAFLPAIAKQKIWLGEVGYYFHTLKLQPFFQYNSEKFDVAGHVDEDRFFGGLAYYLQGHNSNIKVQFGRLEPKGGVKRNQFNVQYQVFAF